MTLEEWREHINATRKSSTEQAIMALTSVMAVNSEGRETK